MDTDAVLAKGTPADLTFDEFRNFQLRERNRKANQEDPDKLTTTSVGATTKEKPKGKESQISGATDNASAKASATQDRGGDVGAFLENAQVQSFIVILLTIDTFVAMGVLILGNHIASVNRAAGAEEFPGSADSAGTEVSLPSEVYNLFFGMFSLSSLYQTLITFNSFVVAFFSFEVALVLVVFGTRATGHWGYLLDAIIVSGQVYGELSGAGQFSHLFNILRYWRLLRLVNYLVLNEQDLHDSTKAELVHAQTALQNAESNVKRLELEMLREQEARTAVDEMLQSYKEEVDTLNEALKIAAMDIAEVAEADDDLLSDDDAIDEQESVLTSSLHSKSHASRTEVDDEGFSDAPGSRRDKALNRASMLREAKKDNASLGGASSGSRGGRSGVTFVVQPNGNYEQK